jgi:hypothetical protein
MKEAAHEPTQKQIEHGKERTNARDLIECQHPEPELVARGNFEKIHNAPDVEAAVGEGRAPGDERG